MSAELTITNGKAEMMFTGETPWHKMGTQLPALATAEQAMVAAGLDWRVEKRPIFTPSVTGSSENLLTTDRHLATVRTDKNVILGVVGTGYVPFQNKNAFSFMDAVVQDKAAIYETAGSLKEGRVVWMLAKLDGVMRVKGGDISESYLLLSNGHDGFHGLRIGLTTVRVVCANTLAQALSGKKQANFFKLRHSTNIGERVEAVRGALGLVNVQLEELNAKMNALAEVKVNASKLETYFEALGFNPDAEKGKAKETFGQLVNAFESGPGSGLDSAKGTMWGAFNAVTYWADHLKAFRSEENKLSSTFFGDTAVLKERAFETALAFTK